MPRKLISSLIPDAYLFISRRYAEASIISDKHQIDFGKCSNGRCRRWLSVNKSMIFSSTYLSCRDMNFVWWKWSPLISASQAFDIFYGYRRYKPEKWRRCPRRFIFRLTATGLPGLMPHSQRLSWNNYIINQLYRCWPGDEKRRQEMFITPAHKMNYECLAHFERQTSLSWWRARPAAGLYGRYASHYLIAMTNNK